MGFFNISKDADKNIGFYSDLKGAMSYLKAGDNFLVFYGWMIGKTIPTGSTRHMQTLLSRLFLAVDQNGRFVFSDYRLSNDKETTNKSLFAIKKIVIKMNYAWTLGFMSGHFAERPKSIEKGIDPSGVQSGSDIGSNITRTHASQDHYVDIASGSNAIELYKSLNVYANSLEASLKTMREAVSRVNQSGTVSDDIIDGMPPFIQNWYKAIDSVSDSYSKIEELDDIGDLDELEAKINMFIERFEDVFEMHSGVSQLGNAKPEKTWVAHHPELLTLYTHARSVYDKIRDPKFAGQLRNMVNTLKKLSGATTRVGTKNVSEKIIDYIREQQDALSKYVIEMSKLFNVDNNNTDEELSKKMPGFDFDLANVSMIPDALRDMANKIKFSYNKHSDKKSYLILNRYITKYSKNMLDANNIDGWGESNSLMESDFVPGLAHLEDKIFDIINEANSYIDETYSFNRLLNSINESFLESINDIVLDIDKILIAMNRFTNVIDEAKLNWKEDIAEMPVAATQKLLNSLVRVADICDERGMVELADEADMAARYIANFKLSHGTNPSIKIAKVRSSKDDRCPFKLSIPIDCSKIGEKIMDMYPAEQADDEEELDQIIRINQKIKKRTYRKKKTARCKFAESVMDDSVICNYGEVNAGVQSVEFGSNVSGAYPMMWSGMFTLPLSWGFSGAESYMGRTPGTATNAPFGMSPGYQGYLKPRLEKFAVKLYNNGLESLAEDLMVNIGR